MYSCLFTKVKAATSKTLSSGVSVIPTRNRDMAYDPSSLGKNA
jgi:hypothetical protein